MIKKTAPDFTLEDLNGQKVSLSDLKGKIVILDFWATWCSPCIQSFPGMQASIEKYKDDDRIKFIFVNTWESDINPQEKVKTFLKNNNYLFNVLFDNSNTPVNAIATSYGVRGIPHKVVIDQNGFIRFESSGSSSNINSIVSEMSAKIELILTEPQPNN
ncbi:TlpA family protein disulfide reductase [Sphingobacterium sp. WQ 366]|uniref:TlpA family protein disulfide reductase n=2 Tax=Sphingobacterium bovistauri TaxID=2781959 RepID=A0ABS7Z4J5_9SPHI|nr:TlpA family protein disulfide reductase [Sphingobacterium bovistauri]